MLLLSRTWHDLFVPTHSIMVMFARGSIVYLAIFALLRFVLNRQTGGLSTPGILLVVLLADVARSGMANEYRSVTKGIIVVCTHRLLVFRRRLAAISFSHNGTLTASSASAPHQKWSSLAAPSSRGLVTMDVADEPAE